MNILQLVSNMKKNGPAFVVYDLVQGLAEEGNNVFVASEIGELAESINNICNAEFVHIPIGRLNGNKIKRILCYFRNANKAYKILKKLIKDKHIEIINSHQPIPNLYARRLSKKFKIPFVTTSHNVYSKGFFSSTYVSGDHVVAVSEKVLTNSIMNFKVDKSRITCVCNGINPNRLLVTDEIKYNNKFVIGTIAGLRKQKALNYLILAFFEFHKIVQNSYLVICGEGEERKILEELVKDLRIEESVCFLGFRSDTANVINSFDIFALSSQYEGLPISMLEAMALKKPIVATKVGGIPEVIVDKENGLLTDYTDYAAMSSCFKFLYENRIICQQIANKGYDTIVQKFNYKIMAKEYIKIYNDLLSRG